MSQEKKHLLLHIVSLEASLFSGKVKQVTAVGDLGELGILPGHTPLMTILKPGELRYILENGDESLLYVSGGMLEVQPDTVTVLADTVIRAEDLDEEKALKARKNANQSLSSAKDLNYSKTLAQLAESTAQIAIIKKLRRTKKLGR